MTLDVSHQLGLLPKKCFVAALGRLGACSARRKGSATPQTRLLKALLFPSD